MPTRPKVCLCRRGTTTVEFAMTAPILFTLVWGAVEFSRANVIRHTTIVAATEAARKSIIPGATVEECLATAQSELAIIGINSAIIEIDPKEITVDTEQVTIYIEVPLNGSNGFILPGFIRGRAIEKSVTLQRESAASSPSEEKTGLGKGNASAKATSKWPLRISET
jgi:hypothetical protein